MMTLRISAIDSLTIQSLQLSVTLDSTDRQSTPLFHGIPFRRTAIMSFVTRRALSTLIPPKAIGGAPDALRMQRVVSFYEKLPRGAAPEVKSKGLLGWYQAKYFGKKTSVQPIIHALVFLVGIGYAQNYYYHLLVPKDRAFSKDTLTKAYSCFKQVDQVQHVVPEPSDVNGTPPVNIDDIENKRITIVEEQSNSADVSVSGGSDTETSRTDGARHKDGDKSHGRTSSAARKPATFKAVSVNKTFLAAKASPSGGSPKTSERPTPSSTPEPKKFTDEELKKYGIHMASRLNEDDAQGQNKWADIDDDDDDWAPEAITWGDGTKTTLPHPDEAVTVASDSGSVGSKEKGMEKPKSPAPLGLAGPTFTKPSFVAGKGLVLKPASQEKPALVAKPPAPPAPAKSPWATLPPVDRASPASAEAARVQGNAPFSKAPHDVPPPAEPNAIPPVSAPPVVDEVEYQKKLMRERVELARKRRQEEEAREEAERRERIQKKLEALGPLPDKKTDKREATAKDEGPKPKHIQQREQPPAQKAPEQAPARCPQRKPEGSVPKGRAPSGAGYQTLLSWAGWEAG
ncbi:hypothetical protein O9K51_04313 [Purpureocillium lavendulum]|uniref:ATP synthase subunit f, mitochondrial n=1 Tax=Purpureocillium lavendulum TaxID=1247861 RepID=A0AB34FW76_9HYPO|nr:hypothetical protein O9K51_04313 [Purpureocillium lavendulum]